MVVLRIRFRHVYEFRMHGPLTNINETQTKTPGWVGPPKLHTGAILGRLSPHRF